MYPGLGYPGLYWPPVGPTVPPEIFDFDVYLDRVWDGDVQVDRTVDEVTLAVMSVGEVDVTVELHRSVTMSSVFMPTLYFDVETER